MEGEKEKKRGIWSGEVKAIDIVRTKNNVE